MVRLPGGLLWLAPTGQSDQVPLGPEIDQNPAMIEAKLFQRSPVLPDVRVRSRDQLPDFASNRHGSRDQRPSGL